MSPWIVKFRISEENLEKWRQEAGPNEDLLRWCLLNGKINEAEYLEWACQYYELPVVESSWFSLPPDTEFWDKARKTGPWHASLFPLHAWQSHVLIACIEPVPEARFTSPHRFVLASARALDMLWTSLNHNLNLESTMPVEESMKTMLAQGGSPPNASSLLSALPRLGQSSKVVDATEPIDSPALKGPASKAKEAANPHAPEAAIGEFTHGYDEGPNGIPLDFSSLGAIETPEGLPKDAALSALKSESAPPGAAQDFFASLAAQTSEGPKESESPKEVEAPAEPVETPAIDVPDGLSLAAADIKISFDFGSLDSQPAASESARAPSHPVSPTVFEPTPQASAHSGFDFDSTEDSPDKTIELARKPAPPPPPPPRVTKPQASASAAPPPPPPRDTQGMPLDSAKPVETKAPVLVNRDPIESVESHPSDVVHKKEATQTRSVDLKTNIETTPVPNLRKPGSTTEFAICNTYDEVTDCAFLNMKDSFEKGIMLVFQGGQLRAWKWTGTVSYAGRGKPTQIDLSAPSIFRVVFNTCLPYHGYVVGNSVNNAFFAEFNGGAIPSHVTIAPILIQGQIAGMIMGMTDSQVNYRHTLQQMETIASEVSKAFQRIRGNKVA